jgi:hypothetical protein
VKQIFQSNNKKRTPLCLCALKNKQVVSKGGKYVSNKESVRLPRKVKNNRGMQTHANPLGEDRRRSKKKKES